MGAVSAAAVGIIFAGLCLITARHSMLLAEGAGAIFLLICGVLYPVDFLPQWTQIASVSLPMTYWMELVRRAFGSYTFSPRLSRFSDASIMIWLALLTAAFCLVSLGVFKLCENFARRHGKIDQATNY